MSENANQPRAKRARRGEAGAFLADLFERKDEVVGCVTWPFSRNGSGYGQANIDGKTRDVHRYVCEIVNGPPPNDDSQARHLCGRGHLGCVSPACLVWGSPKDNAADRDAHGTSVMPKIKMGADNPSSKLTEAQAASVHVLRAQGMPYVTIGKALGISDVQAKNIATGKRWPHLHPANQNIAPSHVSRNAS